MLWNEISIMSNSRSICRDLSLEKQLNKKGLLQRIYLSTLQEMGLTASQTISNQLFFDKLGRVIISFAKGGMINSRKILALIEKHGETEACQFLGRTAVCLMEDWGLIKGGPKI
jgi:hypothetical protein